MPSRRRIRVEGRVQGVGFRASVEARARAEGLAGWVRNRPDGSVEAVFEGDEGAVGRLVAYCGRGPRGADVEDVEIAEEPPEGLGGFAVR